MVFDATQLTEAVSPLNHLGRKIIFGLYIALALHLVTILNID